MALVATSGGFWFPTPIGIDNAAPTFTGVLLDSALEAIAPLFQVSSTGFLNRVGFMTGTVTTGATLDVRIETVDTQGLPSGTLYQSSSNVLFKIIEAQASRFLYATLGSDTLVHTGSTIALRIQNQATSAGNLLISYASNVGYHSFPWIANFTASAWTKTANASPACSLIYTDSRHIAINYALPYMAISTQTIQATTEAGLKFQLPFPCRLYGIWVNYSNAGKNLEFQLYDTDTTTVMARIFTIGSAQTSIASSGIRFFQFPGTSIALASTAFYRLTVMSGVTGGNTPIINYFIATNAAIMEAFDGGIDAHWTFRINSGAWTDTTNYRPFMGLLLTAADNGAGGGTTNVFTAAGAWGF